MFSVPSVKEIIKRLLLDTSFDRYHVKEKNGEFYYRPTANTPELPCKAIYEADSGV